MNAIHFPHRLLVLAFLGSVHAGPIVNGGFDAAGGINPWTSHSGSRIALSNCSSSSGTSVDCTSAAGLVAGMRISGTGLVTNPPNAELIVAQPISPTNFGVSGGTIVTCPSSLLGSFAAVPPALTVTRSNAYTTTPSWSLRVDGRDSPVDGVKQTVSGLQKGLSYTTRFAIRMDAPAQVRCLLQVQGGGPPTILAETVVDSQRTGQWVTVEGTNTVDWTGTQTFGQIYFAIEQIYALGIASPAGVFPGYYLDSVEMEIDTDGDGFWDSEEVPGGKNTNPMLADSDGDGMPDPWEFIHHLLPNDPNDAAQDMDQDGHTNRIEYAANTDPEDAASYPGIPSDDQASPATRALLYFLQTRNARGNGQYLTGHHAQDVPADYNTYVAGLNTLMTAAGHPSWVSIFSIAAEGPTAAQPMQIATSAPALRDYMDAGGLGIIHWTPRNPWTNNHNGDRANVDIPDLLTPGTTANVRMTGWMDSIATEIATLGPDRPVIFRPFSEQNGNWNWYGRIDRDQFIQLYGWVRDYFVVTKKLHNIIWTIEHHIGAHRPIGAANAGVSMDYYYPGDAMIDLVGFSNYVSGWKPWFNADAISRLHPKAFAITEGGPPPNEDDVPNNYNALYLDALDTWFPRSAFFVIWNSWPTGPYVAIKDNANYVELLTDPRVTNRESLRWNAPANLSASAASSTRFALDWDGTTGATSYLLESSANGQAPWTPAGTSTPSDATLGGFTPKTTRHFRVRAIYPDGDSAPLPMANATTWTLYQQWKHDTLGDFSSSDSGDQDADGLPTLLEYGLAGDPRSFTQPPQCGLSSSNSQNYLTLTFRRRVGNSGISYVVESTADLINGPWLPDPVPHGSPIDLNDGTESITYRDIVPITGAPSRFLRLKITEL